MAKQNGILYSAPMVEAKRAGRKTQTRRIINFDKYQDGQQPATILSARTLNENHWKFTDQENNDGNYAYASCPYGCAGDLLYGREQLYCDTQTNAWHYKADGLPVEVHPNYELDAISWAHHKEADYCPSIHMPRFCARIWDEITAVRTQRLHDISEEDAIAEGIAFEYPHYYDYQADDFALLDTCEISIPGLNIKKMSAAGTSYITLWAMLHGAESVRANPWVWVIQTRRTARPDVLLFGKDNRRQTAINPSNHTH